MSKLRKTKNNKLILVLPIILVVSFVVLLTYSFANFKSIKLFDAVGGFFLGNEYTLSYDVANCTNKTIKNGKTFGELCVPAIPDGYTFEGWYYNDELIEATTQVHTNQNIQLLAHFTQNNSCVIGKTYDFDYTGDVQQFTASCPGQYKLEAWGAQGGDYTYGNTASGGTGGYSVGSISLTQNEQLDIYVGGKGIAPIINSTAAPGGYNGGGTGSNVQSFSGYNWTVGGAGGGGATHIAKHNASYTTLSTYVDASTASNFVLLVAGGGGGAGANSGNSVNQYNNGGIGGGIIGSNGTGTLATNYSEIYYGTGGTQTTGGSSYQYQNLLHGSFGKGGNNGYTASANQAAGGGAGWFGGGAGFNYGASGGGGSGYVGNSSLYNKHMTCYNCTTDNNVDTKTISNTCHNANPTVDCSKEGNGYARITYLGNVTEFAYTGNYQEFIVPLSGIYQVELWGAQGGSTRHVDATGLGGYTKGSVYLTANQKLYLYIGQKGEDGGTVNKSPQASFNGGGAGGNSNGSVSSGTYYVSGSGGGATDIRFFGSSSPSSSNLTWNSNLGLNSRIMVAGGGGGSGYLYINDSTWSGAPSGGLIGYDSGEAGGASHLAGATGATQSTGGITSQNLTYGSYSWTKGNNGTFGVGANSVVDGHPGGGGGGGYYGGASGGSGGGSCGGAGGSGGSSYISGHAGSIAIAEGDTNNPRTIKTGCNASSTNVDCSKHYSGLYFTNTVMIDGSGYNWTTTKGSLVNQPQPDGTTATGHSGNGYARITYLGTTLPSNLITTLNSSSIIVSSNDDPSNSANNVFDNDDSTLWTARTKTNEYIGYHFDNPVRVVKVVLKPSNTAGYARVKNFRIEASNNNSTWTTLYTGLYDNQTQSIKKEYSISNNSYYSYYRIYVIDNHATQTNMYVRIDTLEFHGYN